MENVKKCPACSKFISEDLGLCWECWNEDRKKKDDEYFCEDCGIDISHYEYSNFKTGESCNHSTETKPVVVDKLSERQYRNLEYNAVRAKNFGQELAWQKLERKNAEETLTNLIDESLMLGNKEDFLKLTDKLKRLKGEAING